MRASAVVNCQSALAWMGVAIILPCGDFADQGLFVGDASIQTLG